VAAAGRVVPPPPTMDIGLGSVVPNAASTVAAVGQRSPAPVVRALGSVTGGAVTLATVAAEVGATVGAVVGAVVAGAGEAVELPHAARLNPTNKAIEVSKTGLLCDTLDASFRQCMSASLCNRPARRANAGHRLCVAISRPPPRPRNPRRGRRPPPGERRVPGCVRGCRSRSAAGPAGCAPRRDRRGAGT
jgi:hypothetical protein